MGALDSLEKSLDGVLGSKAPVKLPENGKKTIAEWLPWISLALGLLTLWAAYSLWHWADVADEAVEYVNSLSRAFGGTEVVADRFTAGIWLGLIVVAIEGVLYLAAFPALKARKKSGWNLVFYAALVNIVYAVVLLFTDYGGAGNFILNLIGSVIGLWLLFQIRSVYTGSKATSSPPAAG